MWLTIRPEELDIETRQLDTLFWSSILGKSQAIRKVLPKRADKVIGGDLFNALYQWNPRVKDDPPDPALAAWLSNTMSQPSFEQLRSKTVGDRNLAAGATVRLYKELMRPKDSMIKTVAQVKENLEYMEVTGASEVVVSAIKQAQEKLGEAINNTVTSEVDITARPKFSRALAERWDKEFGANQDATQALQNTVADLDVASNIASFNSRKGVSLDPNATSERVLDCMTDESVISRVTANDSLRKIFQVAGRMSVILQQAKSKKPKPAPPPVSLTYGSEISSVLASELGSLADPELEDMFWLRFLEGGLLQYDHKARVNEGLGPFVCCVDYSGSMSGQSLEYAKALFVSLARMAVAKRRKVVYIPFATRAADPEFITSGHELLSVLSMTGRRDIGGGTRFEPPLTSASNLIHEEIIYHHADVLFITDGVSIVKPDWQEKFIQGKNKLGFRLVGVNIMGDWDKQQLPMFDAVASMSRQGEISKLEWLSNIAERIV